jgi:hypothetical protein
MLVGMGLKASLRARLFPPYDDNRGLTPDMVSGFASAIGPLQDLVAASQGMAPVKPGRAYYRWTAEGPANRTTYHVGHSGYLNREKPWLAYAQEVDTLPGLPFAEMSGRQLGFRPGHFATATEAVSGFARLIQQDLAIPGRASDLLRSSRVKVSSEQLARLAKLADDLLVG